MTIFYSSAMAILVTAAQQQSRLLTSDCVPVDEAIDRVISDDITCPAGTPRSDTSAMDGYAVSSESTRSASANSPVYLQVCGTIAAGDQRLTAGTGKQQWSSSSLMEPCFEIMTGAIFPAGFARDVDACVRVEDTFVVAEKTKDGGRVIAVTRPVRPLENKRLAGGDLKRGQVLLEAGTALRPHHVLPLVSSSSSSSPLSHTDRSMLVPVRRKPRVGLWSSGKEMTATSGPARLPDVNAPYLLSALRDAGAAPSFLGVLEDDALAIKTAVQQSILSGDYDILVTTGGVSVGKYDLLASTLADLGADIKFHGLAIRPGHPALFALLPTTTTTTDGARIPARDLPIFGLPGNPGAAAACFRFLLRPYLRILLGRRPPEEKPTLASLQSVAAVTADGGCFLQKRLLTRDTGKVLFKHGVLCQASDGSMVVELSEEQSPAKLAPYLEANCWVKLDPASWRGEAPDLVPCYSL